MSDEERDDRGRLVSVVVDGQRFHREPTGQPRSDDLSVIETRAANATPGPWKVWAMEVLADPVGDSNLDTALPIARTSDPHRGLRTFNADFIAAARSDVPALVAEVRSLRGVVQAVEAQLDYMDSLKAGLMHNSEFRDGLNAAIGRVRHALARPCRHCGKGPDDDGDHSCTCPHPDADCPDHPLAAAADAPQPEDLPTCEHGHTVSHYIDSKTAQYHQLDNICSGPSPAVLPQPPEDQ